MRLLVLGLKQRFNFTYFTFFVRITVKHRVHKWTTQLVTIGDQTVSIDFLAKIVKFVYQTNPRFTFALYNRMIFNIFSHIFTLRK